MSGLSSATAYEAEMRERMGRLARLLEGSDPRLAAAMADLADEAERHLQWLEGLKKASAGDDAEVAAFAEMLIEDTLRLYPGGRLSACA